MAAKKRPKKVIPVKKMSTAKKVGVGLGVAAGVAGLAYGAEKLAEKMGVRGGAGFVGKRRGKGRKKSAAWYAKNILRLRLKKRYDKMRLSI